MARIKNTTTYPTVTPALADFLPITDVSDSDKTKTVLVGDLIDLVDGTALENGVLSGAVTWLQNLTFEVSDLVVVIGGTVYSVDGAFITLDDADDDNPRIDTISVFIDLTEETQEIINTTGVAAEFPAKPFIENNEIELELTFIEIAAGASSPTGVSTDLIYDEDAGSPAEWDAVALVTSAAAIDLASTDASNTNDISISVIESSLTDGDLITFTSDSAFLVEDIGSIHFYVQVSSSVVAEVQVNSIDVTLYDGTTLVSTTVRVENGYNGFDTSVLGSFQSIIIPITDFSFLTTVNPSITAIRFTFQGSLGAIIFIDTINLVLGVNNPPGTNTYLGLTDTIDTVYTGKVGFSAVVNDTATALELTKVTSIESGLLSGAVTWIEDLEFEVSDLEVVINGIFYEVPGVTITLDDADDDNPRIDLITVTTNTATRPTGVTISNTTGTAAASPSAPVIADTTVELQLTFIEIAAAATEPTDVSVDLIYDENTGSTAEWDAVVTETTTGAIVLDSTAFPNTNSTSILATASDLTDGDLITFTSDADIDITDISSISFYLAPFIGGSSSVASSIDITLFDGSTLVSNTVKIIQGYNGFDSYSLGAYQVVIVPITDFSFLTSVTTTIDTIVFTFQGSLANLLYIDTINLVLGVNNPAATNTFLGLTDVDDTIYTDKAGFAATVNDNETGLELTTTGVGDVLKVGTPVDEQVGVWTGDGTLAGFTSFTFDEVTLTVDSILAGSTITLDGAVSSTTLSLDSTTGVLRLPRLTTTQRDALTALTGFVIFNTTTLQVESYNGTSWVVDNSEWSTFSGTRAGGDLLVTLGDYDDTGNGTNLLIDDANGLITIDGDFAVGGNTGINLTSVLGAYQLLGTTVLFEHATRFTLSVGLGAGTGGSGTENVFVGTGAGNSQIINDNVAVGYNALNNANNGGSSNVAIGHNAMLISSQGFGNVAIGESALIANTTASNNTAVGYQTLLANTTGASNIAVGSQALDANTTGSFNTAVGALALGSSILGRQNTCIGSLSGFNLISAVNTGANTFVGYNSGRSITTGVENTIIGANLFLTATLSNNIILADGAGDIRMQFDSSGDGNIGGDLEVEGAFIDSTGSAGTSGQILSSTVSGTLWIDP